MFWRRKPSVTDDQLREIVKALRNLREDLDDLAHKHERLRGKFYGTGRHKPEEPTDNTESAPGSANANRPARESKAELLARYWQPGRAAVHPGT